MSEKNSSLADFDDTTVFNTNSPQSSKQQILKRKNTPTIALAATLQQLDVNLLHSVAAYFDLDLSRSTANSESDLIAGILTAAHKIGAVSECLDAEIAGDTLCCFNRNGQMLCSLLSFDESTFNVDMPNDFRQVTAYLSSLDRLKFLSQIPLFWNPNNHGIAELEWVDLTKPQMQSVLLHYDIRNDNHDSANDLKRRILSHRPFTNTHGAEGKVALFSFSVEEPMTLISISSVPLEDNVREKLVLPNITNDTATLFSSHASQISSPDSVALNASSSLTSSPDSTKPLSCDVNQDSSTLLSTSINSALSETTCVGSEDIIDGSEGYESSRSPDLSVDQSFVFTVAQKKNQGVIDSLCVKCRKTVSETEVLTCYLCKLAVHYCCYKGQRSQGKNMAMCKTDFDKLSKSKNNKWFCNGCSRISFNDILQVISQYTQEKFNEAVEEQNTSQNGVASDLLTTEPDAGSLSPSSLPDYNYDIDPEPKIESLRQLKEVITEELRAALKEEMNTLLSAIPTLPVVSEPAHALGQRNSLSYASMTAQAVPTVPLNDSKIKGTMNPHARKSATPRLNQQGQSVKAHHLVDPSMSVIIKQVTNKKIVANDTTLKSEFNKIFKQMKIKYCKKTRYGNIILQLNSEKDIQEVLHEWKPYFFKDSNATVGTQIFRMKDQHLTKHVGIIRHVPTEISEASIKEGLQEANLNNTQVKRLSKMNKPLTSVKIVFASHGDLNRAKESGFGVKHLWLEVAEFKFTKTPMQCHGCKRFGHPVKWCRSKIVCGYCSSEEHSDRECMHKDDLLKHQCRNCHGNHTAFSRVCPNYIKNLSLIKQNSDNE